MLQKQTHGKRDQIRGYQKWRVWGKGVFKEGGQKVQTSGCKINPKDVTGSMVTVVSNESEKKC